MGNRALGQTQGPPSPSGCSPLMFGSVFYITQCVQYNILELSTLKFVSTVVKIEMTEY